MAWQKLTGGALATMARAWNMDLPVGADVIPRFTGASAHTIRKWAREKRPAVFARDGHACTYCGWRPGDPPPGVVLVVDHCLPVSRGGRSSMSNLTTACDHCDRIKKSATAAEFRASVHFWRGIPVWRLTDAQRAERRREHHLRKAWLRHARRMASKPASSEPEPPPP